MTNDQILVVSYSDLVKIVDERINVIKSEPLANKFFSIAELREYLPSKPSIHTLYKHTRTGKLPFHKAGGKLVFLKSEIDKIYLGLR
jgi:hypothetical protein